MEGGGGGRKMEGMEVDGRHWPPALGQADGYDDWKSQQIK